MNNHNTKVGDLIKITETETRDIVLGGLYIVYVTLDSTENGLRCKVINSDGELCLVFPDEYELVDKKQLIQILDNISI